MGGLDRPKDYVLITAAF